MHRGTEDGRSNLPLASDKSSRDGTRGSCKCLSVKRPCFELPVIMDMGPGVRGELSRPMLIWTLRWSCWRLMERVSVIHWCCNEYSLGKKIVCTNDGRNATAIALFGLLYIISCWLIHTHNYRCSTICWWIIIVLFYSLKNDTGA